MERVEPPPIRRILVDAEPTTVAPPPRRPADGDDGAENGQFALGSLELQRKRFRRSTGHHAERMTAESLTIAYSGKVAVNSVDLPVRQGEVLALIGPSGCGKTRLLRSLNRLVELTPAATRAGRISLDGRDVDSIEVTELRRRVSMVFQQPNPFPMSIFDNVAYALREQGSRRPSREDLRPAVTDALERAGAVRRGRATTCRTPRCACRVGSSSGCASHARSPRGRRCCCSTSRAPRSTRAPRRRSRT